MDSRARQLLSLLVDLECHMRRADLWRARPPSAEALTSSLPFCIDTLEFNEWLQFVFIVKLHSLATTEKLGTIQSQVAPMAEERLPATLRNYNNEIIETLSKIDVLLNCYTC